MLEVHKELSGKQRYASAKWYQI